MVKKATLTEIAKEAGVSVATVSYVLGKNNKQKINHNTRMKILDIAKEKGYTPNSQSKSALRHKTNTLAILIFDDSNITVSAFHWQTTLVRHLTRLIQNAGFIPVEILVDKDCTDYSFMEKYSVDGVFIIDANNDYIYDITNKFYVPVVFVDSILNDSIFCNILPDYDSIITRAVTELKSKDKFIILDKKNNDIINEIICRHFSPNNIFYNTTSEKLDLFLENHQHSDGIVISEILGLEVCNLTPKQNIVVLATTNSVRTTNKNYTYIPVNLDKVAEKAFEIFVKITKELYKDDDDTLILV